MSKTVDLSEKERGSRLPPHCPMVYLSMLKSGEKMIKATLDRERKGDHQLNSLSRPDGRKV